MFSKSLPTENNLSLSIGKPFLALHLYTLHFLAFWTGTYFFCIKSLTCKACANSISLLPIINQILSCQPISNFTIIDIHFMLVFTFFLSALIRITKYCFFKYIFYEKRNEHVFLKENSMTCLIFVYEQLFFSSSAQNTHCTDRSQSMFYCTSYTILYELQCRM